MHAETSTDSGLASEIEAAWRIYSKLLLRWQKVINLVGPSTMKVLRERHFNDSLQIHRLVPAADRWVDMGSGAGFPGLVTGLQLLRRPSACVHLIESDQRKCAFLREVSRETGAPVIVHCGRIENVLPDIGEGIQAISARALAPLSKLIELSTPVLLKGAIGVFPKGQDLVTELTGLTIDSRFVLEVHPSTTASKAGIVMVKPIGV